MSPSDEWQWPQESPHTSCVLLASLREATLGGWSFRLSRRGLSRSCQQPIAVVFGCALGGRSSSNGASHRPLGMICPPLTPIRKAENALEENAVEMWSIILGTKISVAAKLLQSAASTSDVSATSVFVCGRNAIFIIQDESPCKGA